MQNTQLWPEKHLWWSIWEIYLGQNGILTVGLQTRDDHQQGENLKNLVVLDSM